MRRSAEDGGERRVDWSPALTRELQYDWAKVAESRRTLRAAGPGATLASSSSSGPRELAFNRSQAVNAEPFIPS